MKIIKRALLLLLALMVIFPVNLALAKDNNGEVLKAFSKEKIMAKDTANKTIDLEYKGIVSLSENYSVYKYKEGKFIKSSLSEVLVGTENVTVYYNEGGQADLIFIDGETPTKNMRVGIMNSGFVSLEHDVIDFQSADGYVIQDKKAGTKYEVVPNTSAKLIVDNNQLKVTISGAEVFRSSNRLYILPKTTTNESSKIKIDTFKRAYGNPSYRGFFEITLSKTPGKINIINEVDMEDYLLQVVPSEMPASFGAEALKAQAVAARTYAMGDYLSNRYASKGFFVDDSTLSQVYNNSAENADTTAAVKNTSGKIMMSNGALVDARYYSTSGGFGAAKHEVWSDPGSTSFPGTPLPYLIAQSFTYDPKDPSNKTMLKLNTQDEAAINAFYKDLSYLGYDSTSAYFRWKVSLTKEQIQNTINKNILIRYAAEPDFILTKDSNGKFVNKQIPADGIGTFKNMYVAKRGSGGNIMELIVEGSNGTFKIIKEFNIRFTIRPNKVDTGASTDIIAQRAKGGSKDYDPGFNLKNPSILYSAFFTFDFEKDSNNEITNVIFYGGGNGHGAGMSQYGASALGANGWTFDKILTAYYANMNFVDLNKTMVKQTSPLNMMINYGKDIKDKAEEGIKAGNHRIGSKGILQKEIDKAVAVSSNSNSSEEEIRQAVLSLRNSIEVFNASIVSEEEAAQLGKEKQAIDAIQALPQLDKLTLDHEEAVNKARELVTAANNDSAITNLPKLVALESRIKELKNPSVPKDDDKTEEPKDNSNGNGNSNVKDTENKLPKTGSYVDISVLLLIGMLMLSAGIKYSGFLKKAESHKRI